MNSKLGLNASAARIGPAVAIAVVRAAHSGRTCFAILDRLNKKQRRHMLLRHSSPILPLGQLIRDEDSKGILRRPEAIGIRGSRPFGISEYCPR